MKTHVIVLFNTVTVDYVFNIELNDFIKKWENHITAIGYFSEYDADGKYITINPSNCGTVEISKWDDWKKEKEPWEE